MSTSKGSNNRSRPQKHQNRTGFKNTLHDSSDFQKKLNNLSISEVCLRCKQVIDWKIKYRKYKPLKQPKTCIKCQQKTVKKAYHVMCRECAINAKVCAKCLKSADEVEILPPEPTEMEQRKLKGEMDKLIKALPERKRRSFLRYMAKGEKIKLSPKISDIENNTNKEVEEADNDEKEIDCVKRIPHSREALLKKIEELKINENDEDDISCSDDDFDDDDDDIEEESEEEHN